MTKTEIEATIRDYFEGWYDGDADRMERALHAELVKRRAGDALGVTTKARMLELTAAGAGAEDGADRTLEIEVHDVYGASATATVRSAVYHEHLHLVLSGGRWRIANTLWELQ